MDDIRVLELDIFDLANRTFDAYPEPPPFSNFGPYRILNLIGSGGMGDVFLAEDQDAGRLVAIKFLRSIWSEPDSNRCFSREVHMLAQLEHANIARLYAIGVHPNGAPYFAMEYVEGKNLDEYCRERDCSLPEKLRLFLSVCEAVRYAHSRATIHLDLKPCNILVKADGTPKLLDFGIGRHLENVDEPVNQTELRCTPAYAAPEQIRREPVGTYTDVYTLGVILYELLAGCHPYQLEGRTVSEVEALVTGDAEPPKPSVSPTRVQASKSAWSDLDVLCLKALRKDPQSRYRSVVELTQDVEHFRRGEPLQARPESFAYRLTKFLHRYRRAVLALATMLVLLAGLVTFYTIRLAKARDAALMEAARTKRIQRFMLSMFGGDANAAPSGELRVVDILDHGVTQAGMLKKEPATQAELYETLGSIYQLLGQLDRSDSLLHEGLKQRESVFGFESPEAADSLTALALLRVDQGQFADAGRVAHKAVAIDRQKLAANDPRLGKALTGLGSVLQHSGAYAEAIETLQQAIAIQSTPTTDPADLEASLTYLANTYHALGHDAEALSLHRRVLVLDRQIYGDYHATVAEDFLNIGQTQEQLGQYAEAERNERSSVDLLAGWYGPDRAETAVAAEGLAETLIYEHEYAEAAALLQPAIRILERDFGKDNPFVALAWNLQGLIALRRGNLDVAHSDFSRMDKTYRLVFGEHDKHVAIGFLRFGELDQARGDYARSEKFFRDAVQLFSTRLGPDNVLTGTAQIELGEVLLRQRRLGEAETQLLTGYRTVSKGRSPSLEAAVTARQDLVSLYEALHMPEKAGKFRGAREQARKETGTAKKS